MPNHRKEYYYMTIEERRKYHLQKTQEWRERKAALYGKTIKHREIKKITQ